MESQLWLLGWWCVCVWVLSLGFRVVRGQAGALEGTVSIDGKSSLGYIDDDFVCATLDWWPPEKCDYGTCSWGHASLLNLDLNNKVFFKAVKAFSPLKIRLGGTLQDKVIYDTKDNHQPCLPFVRNTSEMFGFSNGCLPMYRWDELNGFFENAGAKVIFGLNALAGKLIHSDGSTTGNWNFTNAESLIEYTVGKNFTIHGWELGNELSGHGIGASIAADQYAADTTALRNIVQKLYEHIEPKPLVIAPGGFFDESWMKEFISNSRTSLDVVTHHIYNLGPGVDTHLVEKILDPSYLDGEADTFRRLQNTIKTSPTSATSWVGEAGGAYNSGHDLVTNAFVFSFWYLDQLGMASTFDTKTYCRQSLIGGNYGLLDTTTFQPNPDYYSALLWHRLMGRNVLPTSFSGSKRLRAYAHCSKLSKGITLLLLNLDNSTAIEARVVVNSTLTLRHKHTLGHKHRSHRARNITLPHRRFTQTARLEYHLTAKDGNLHSQIMLLNGHILTVNATGDIPSLEPVTANPMDPIKVAPLSIVFAHIPSILLPACK